MMLSRRSDHSDTLKRRNHDVLTNSAPSLSRGLTGDVCVLCDKSMSGVETNHITMDRLVKHKEFIGGDSGLPDLLRSQCSLVLDGDTERSNALVDCLLSPRATVIKHKKKRLWKATCCKECKGGWNGKSLKTSSPRGAIANNMAIGRAPSCLTDLNEMELALLSQARFRGHMFCHWGGCHRSIKGWHSFCDVNPGHSVGVMQEVKKLTQKDNICVMLSGPFTSEQKDRVLKKTRVRIDKVQTAFDWLKANNHLHKDVEAPEMETPIVVDCTEEAQSESSDTETREEMRVVFPDCSAKIGGHEDPRELMKAIAELKTKISTGGEAFAVSQPSTGQMNDHEGDTFMKAFPLQFPFGYGHSDTNSDRWQGSEQLAHLSCLSIPAFHEAPFLVAAHNMFEQKKALQGSVWQVMGGKQRCDVSEEDLNKAISEHCNGVTSGNGPGKAFMESLRAVKRNMAHTNQAAQANQAKFIGLSHHFGCAKAMLTVSFDDGLDIRVAALSGKEGVEHWLDSMDGSNCEDLAQRMSELSHIRVKCPGLCALNFEWLLEAVLTHVVGDNEKREGLFGILEAFGTAVEEQGRKTLHTHILTHCRGWNELLKLLQSPCPRDRARAEKEVVAFVDEVVSTELVPNEPENMCPLCKKKTLTIKDDQTLRNLRHKVGCHMEQAGFIDCNECKRSFTGDDLAQARVMGPEGLQWDEGWAASHLSREVLMEANGLGSKTEEQAVGLVNLRFNHHLCHHTKTCFKKSDEGRCCLPDIPEEKTRVHFEADNATVFDWRGRELKHAAVTIRPKRLAQDAHTNAHCKLISKSTTPCNSNIGITTGARSTICASCHSTKGTQKEDTEDFKKMGRYAASRWKQTRKENPLFEGLSRLMGAVIVNTSEHVCSAPMAACLLRNGSRFQHSHKFKCVPIREMIELLCSENGEENLNMTVLAHDSGCFLNNEAISCLR